MKNWIESFVEEASEAETPTSFLYWAALSTISAVVMDNVYFDRGGKYKVYPNIYVMLVAKSGLRKGLPVDMAETLVENIGNTRVISGYNSIQGIVKEMSYSESKQGSGEIIKHNNAFLVSGELSSFLINDPIAFAILTHLYDRNYNKQFRQHFKISENHNLKNPTLTWLAASNETHFNNFFDAASLTGGLIARTCVIQETKKSKVNSLTKGSRPIDYSKLAEHLRLVAKLRGEMHWAEPTRQKYDDWYYPFQKYLEGIDDDTGTGERIHDTIMKVAMLLSLADFDPKLEVTEGNLDEAMTVCLGSTKDVRKLFVGKTKTSIKTEKSEITHIIMTALLQGGENGVARDELLRKNYGTFDYMDLDRVLDTLRESEAIEIHTHLNKKVYITLKPSVIEYYNKLKAKEPN